MMQFGRKTGDYLGAGSGHRPRRPRFALWTLLILGLAVFVWSGLRVGSQPQVEISSERPAFGGDNQMQIALRAPKRGLYRVSSRLVQGEREVDLGKQTWEPAPAWKFWAAGTTEDVIEFPITAEDLEGFGGEDVTVEVSAWRAPSLLRRPDPEVTTDSFPLRRAAPRLAVLSSHHYPRQGGAEVVVYRAGEHTVRSGVEVAERFFPGYGMPGRDGELFALFAVPWDVDQGDAVQLIAENDAGLVSRRTFVDRFFPNPPSTETIELSTSFFEKVVPEILAATPGFEDRGDPLANYLAINGDLREENAQALRDLAARSKPEVLWRGAFLPLAGGQVMSSFADRRTYLFEGKEVDRQTHLGFDLASVRHAPVQAANSGVVVLADYFGIYGNTVVIDHGFGLMTLYAHMSSIEVDEGQSVERAQVIGRTGETGLAGGDHLHFTVLVGGEQVNPTEWWDPKWINDRLREKLGPDVIPDPTAAGPQAG